MRRFVALLLVPLAGCGLGDPVRAMLGVGIGEDRHADGGVDAAPHEPSAGALTCEIASPRPIATLPGFFHFMRIARNGDRVAVVLSPLGTAEPGVALIVTDVFGEPRHGPEVIFGTASIAAVIVEADGFLVASAGGPPAWALQTRSTDADGNARAPLSAAPARAPTGFNDVAISGHRRAYTLWRDGGRRGIDTLFVVQAEDGSEHEILLPQETSTLEGDVRVSASPGRPGAFHAIGIHWSQPVRHMQINEDLTLDTEWQGEPPDWGGLWAQSVAFPQRGAPEVFGWSAWENGGTRRVIALQKGEHVTTHEEHVRQLVFPAVSYDATSGIALLSAWGPDGTTTEHHEPIALVATDGVNDFFADLPVEASMIDGWVPTANVDTGRAGEHLLYWAVLDWPSGISRLFFATVRCRSVAARSA